MSVITAFLFVRGVRPRDGGGWQGELGGIGGVARRVKVVGALLMALNAKLRTCEVGFNGATSHGASVIASNRY